MLVRWFLLRKIQVFLSKWFLNAYNPYITHLIPYIYIYIYIYHRWIFHQSNGVSSIYDAWSPPVPHPQVRQQASSRSHSVLMLTIERRASKDVTMWLLKRYGGASNTIFTDDEYWWIMKTTFSHSGDDHPESAVINRCFHELTSHLFFDFMMWWCVQLIRRPKHDHHFPRNERQSVGISGYPSSWRTNQDVECIHST